MNELSVQLNALLELYGDEFVKDMRAYMASKGKSASGAANVSLESMTQGSSLLILGNDYIEQISEGRRPGPVSVEGFKRIQDWVKVKGLNRIPEKNVNRYKDIAFVVARKVREKGFPGIGLFEYVINKNIVKLSDDVADTVLEVVGQQLDKTITANFAGGRFGAAI